MTAEPERDDAALDAACGRCGHGERSHVVSEVEVPEDTLRDTYCEDCEQACTFLPEPAQR